MGKVTSRYQVTIPRRLAAEAGVEPGADVQWTREGSDLVVRPVERIEIDTNERLRMFDAATERQRTRERRKPRARARERGWTR